MIVRFKSICVWSSNKSGSSALYLAAMMMSLVMFPSTCTMYDSDRAALVIPNKELLLFSAFCLGFFDGTIQIIFNSIVGWYLTYFVILIYKSKIIGFYYFRDTVSI